MAERNDVVLINQKPSMLICSSKLKLQPGRNRFEFLQFDKLMMDPRSKKALDKFMELGFVQHLELKNKKEPEKEIKVFEDAGIVAFSDDEMDVEIDKKPRRGRKKAALDEDLKEE